MFCGTYVSTFALGLIDNILSFIHSTFNFPMLDIVACICLFRLLGDITSLSTNTIFSTPALTNPSTT